MGHDSASSAATAQRLDSGLTRAGAVRLDSIDLMRGLVIVLMVLDHTRDFFNVAGFDPTDPARTNAVLFATRWVTHLCAPTFVFLAGASIYLQKLNGKTGARLAGFLLSRGLWLIVLELTVISFALNFGQPFFLLQVIWAIGVGMIAFAVLSWLPATWVLGLGVLIVAGHNVFDAVPAESFGSLGPAWTLLMALGPFPFGPGFVAYPAIPWLGIMCLGYGLTPMLFGKGDRGWRAAVLLGFGFLGAFVALRFANQYGDQRPWADQGETARSVMSFLNVSKYPPSLDFVLATLGASFLLLPLVARLKGLPRRVLAAFGRAPLFVFVIHLFLVHGLALLIGVALGFPAAAFTEFLSEPGRLASVHWGLPLAVVYLIWLGVLALLYPMARWFAAVKRERRDWWLSYL